LLSIYLLAGLGDNTRGEVGDAKFLSCVGS